MYNVEKKEERAEILWTIFFLSDWSVIWMRGSKYVTKYGIITWKFSENDLLLKWFLKGFPHFQF